LGKRRSPGKKKKGARGKQNKERKKKRRGADVEEKNIITEKRPKKKTSADYSVEGTNGSWDVDLREGGTDRKGWDSMRGLGLKDRGVGAKSEKA